jgi:hypothetical protein
LRLPRITRTAPEASASAATPEAGLISGTIETPAKAKVEKPAKSNTIPTGFTTVLLHGDAICTRIHRMQQYGTPPLNQQAFPKKEVLAHGTSYRQYYCTTRRRPSRARWSLLT